MPPRLHKVIGYALTDLNTTPNPDYQGLLSIDDPRINPASPLLSWDDDDDDDDDDDEPQAPSLTGYAAWLKDECSQPDHPLRFLARMESRLVLSSLERRQHHFDIGHTVVHRPETGLPGALVLIPPAWLHQFYRSDDAMDMAEWRLRPKPGDLSPTLAVLSAGVGINSTRFMDKDGTLLSEAAAEFVFYAGEGMPEDELDRIAREIRPAGELDGSGIYQDADDARSRIVPHVPMDLRRLAEYGQLFTREDTWKTLRPVVYTFWA